MKNAGSDYGPQGQPIEVNTHDFEDKELGKVVPYGVYDILANLGYVSLGIDHDNRQFAVNAVRLWLEQLGRGLHRGMKRLIIMADGGLKLKSFYVFVPAKSGVQGTSS